MSEDSARGAAIASQERSTSQRRRLSNRVREAREKLTSTGSGSRTFDIELMREFGESRMSSTLLMLAIAVAISGGAAVWAPPERVLGWLALVIIQLLVAHRFYQKMLGAAEGDFDPKPWHQRTVILETVQGVGWALMVLLLFDSPDETAHSLLFFSLLLVSAMSAMMLALIPSAVYGNLIPITAAVTGFVFATSRDPLPLTLIVCMAFAYFLYLSRRFYTTNLSSLTLRLEKDLLIAELEQAKSNSDEARRRAEEASLAKSRFLATMSHELRTPLNAILGFSEVMKGELFGPHAVPAYKGYSSDIHSSGQHLLALINEILDLSRVEAGRYELKEDAVSLAHVIEDCIHLLSLRAEKRDITMTDAIEHRLPRLWADERAVRQVTLNLLTNAIKFTPPGGSVFVKAGWTALGGQYISIRDTGTGIPADEIPVVLSSFGRGTLAQKNADEGSGLGLPIVKGLVELHGGTFTLKSEVRVGTEVIVIFPPERVMDSLPQIDVEDEERTRRRSRARAA
ncbi:MAG: HAMP domain-containing histidine kinase [Beijerinckiaceae bacterium]|nr:HAMP domain-containing histidine kinase [Beijerinckiaceae bacterium]